MLSCEKSRSRVDAAVSNGNLLNETRMTSSRLEISAAQAYERFLVAPLNADMAQHLVALAAPKPGHRLLDIACGTGVVIRAAAASVAPNGSIVGLDSDPAMIAVAQSLVEKPAGVSVEWHCSSAQDMPVPSGGIDTAFCLQGLQYFPDSTACLREVHRVLKPDGRFLGAVWTALEDCKGQHAIASALRRRDVDPAAIVKAYSFGDPDRIRKLSESAGLNDLDLQEHSFTARFESVPAFINAFAEGAMSSRAAISKVPENERAAFTEDVQRALVPYLGGDGLNVPLKCVVIMARK
jgi:ubiquinone/menaquinone biosynthesis C-methylase UbiE